MSLLLQVIFWLCVIGVIHTYVLYPLLLRMLAGDRNVEAPDLSNIPVHDWPQVSVIMSLYNEEQVISKKLDCLLALDYPKERINLFIGSDCSDDQTNEIVDGFAKQYPNIHFFPFQDRSGKPGVVNRLVEKVKALFPIASDHIFLMTDANVMLENKTLKKLVRHFRDPLIGLVDTNMVGVGMLDGEISASERQYLGQEVSIKKWESILWQKMMGPFGGCFAIRSDQYRAVPGNYLVDDFFLCMQVFENGKNAINDIEAICFEKLTHDIWEEYRRKARISAGNFQNLAHFGHWILPPFSATGFAFFSHKVLRWMGPFFIIFALMSCFGLMLMDNSLYITLLYLQVGFLLGIPLLYFLLKQLNIKAGILKDFAYLIIMNVALFEGFIKYCKGIKTNVWQPTKRD